MKKYMTYIALLLFISYIACSCGPIIRTVSKVYYNPKYTVNHASRLVSADGEKEIVLVPMMHIGKEEDYIRIKAYLDTLKGDGYVTFFEGIVRLPFHIDTISDITILDLYKMRDNLHPTQSDSIKMDTLRRKLRRVIGKNIGTYYEELAGKSKVVQSEKKLGLISGRDIWVDYTLADLIELAERKYGPVPLTQYDFDTALGDPKYKSKDNIHKYYLMNGARDKYLEKRILESPHNKIAVVYGAVHTSKMKLYFRYLNGYTVDKKYKGKKVLEGEK